MMLNIDDAPKSSMSWSFTNAPTGVPEEQKGNKLAESTGGMLVKDPPKVKSAIEKFLITQKCES